MFKNLQKNEKGFTIIEVLIVLAIAGLIMLIVFLAIPALQRNQRNNARNTEASRISTSVSECLGNRNGVISSCLNTTNVVVGDLQRFDRPAADGGPIVFSNTTTDPTPANNVTNVAGVWYGRECTDAGDSSVASTTGSRSFVVLYRLEPNILRCISS